MSTAPNLAPSPEAAGRELAMILVKVNDAMWRIRSTFEDGPLNPTSCAYNDGQLAKMIGWLASARAICITQGNLSHPHFDGDETIDLDEEWAIADNAESQGGEGQVPNG